MEVEQPGQSFRPKSLCEARGDEEVIARAPHEVAKVLAMEFQLDTVGREPGQHADGLAALRAKGSVSTADWILLAELGVVAAVHVILEHEEARRCAENAHEPGEKGPILSACSSHPRSPLRTKRR
ncbi:hypothetical protein, partial [Hyalangium sp.]|uniref:hypothetical protein n=1 Tax=Hyalangium sp. TaxID=2028555 RepID=UPI002D2F2847